jgi:hypothetical protein
MVLRRQGGVLPRAVLVLVILFIGSQVIRPDKTNPPVESNMIDALAPPPAVAVALQRGCYNCHSHETAWPWYSAIAPGSWLVANHVKEARENMNFSRWSQYSEASGLHKLEEAVEEVSEGKMPLPSYLILHPGDRWTEEEKVAFARWVEDLKSRRGPSVPQDEGRSDEEGSDHP